MSVFYRSGLIHLPALNSSPPAVGEIQLFCFQAQKWKQISPARSLTGLPSAAAPCWVLYVVLMWFGVEKGWAVRGVWLSESDNRNIGTHIRKD